MSNLTDFDLTGRRALVTGGGDGLGLQLTGALIDAGAEVVICGRRMEPLEEAARALGPAVIPIQADVTASAERQRLVEGAGHIDILVNNAGLAHRATWDSVSEDNWDWIMSVNVDSPFWLIQALAPAMIDQRWGRIINVSSIYGLVGGDHSRYPGQGINIASYFASKHALIGLTKFLAAEFAPFGVTVNALCPGMFPSPANIKVLEPEVINALTAGTPVGRLGTDQDLRTGILFLAAPGSGFVTGHSLVVDGGWTVW